MRHLPLKLQDLCLNLHLSAKALVNDETGQDLIEYAIMGALVAGLAIAMSTTLSGVITNAFTTMGTQVNAAMTAA